ncbi:Gfo/Idh/MocA family oxidoreductase [uncultured Proteiniphilum sp.]|uniref:Gfo/Idh/MocA family protein n=1 Tax=uncultured Proteiniphilum sp. TaxID=497637 RepID=UPI0026215A20|nr:Gfo/Idh/MocA family oxidoreductase [uncultured Proteiniphilum sp.]
MVHWGFIGCGAVTEKKSGPAFSKVTGSDVVAVMRRDGEKAKDYARRHGIGKWYDNADDLIHDPQVNAVYVATPPGSHVEYAVAAMKAGKPVYVEKPMAASYEECLQINRLSEETGVPCFVAYYRRTLPYFLRVKQLIDEGLLGDISTVQIRFAIPPYEEDYNGKNLPWRVKKEIAGAGYFYDLASHQLDLLDYLFGEITDVCGFTHNVAGLYDVEDSVTAAFRFKSGVAGSGSWSFVAPVNTRTDLIDISGTKGRLTCATFDFSPILLETAAGVQEFHEKNPENIQYYLVESIVNYLNGHGNIPVSTGISAARTNWVMDKILGR